MSQCNVDIRIGVDGKQIKELYKNIEVSIEMHQQKLAKFSHQMATILGKTVVPFIVIQYSQTHLENYEVGYHKVGSKLYQYCNPKEKDLIKLIKNTQKQFQKVTKLNNNCTLRLSLYNLLGEQKHENSIQLLNHMKIKGNIQTDPQLISNITQIVRRISIQFLNSPLMAFIELLENLAIKLQLDSVDQFSQELNKTYLQYLNFSSWINKAHIDEVLNAKGEITIYITLPKLMNIKIKGQSAVLAKFLSIF